MSDAGFKLDLCSHLNRDVGSFHRHRLHIGGGQQIGNDAPPRTEASTNYSLTRKLLHFFESGIPVLGLGLDIPVLHLGLHFPQARHQLCSKRTFPLLSYSLDFCNDGRLHEAFGLKQFPKIKGYQIQMVSPDIHI